MRSFSCAYFTASFMYVIKDIQTPDIMSAFYFPEVHLNPTRSAGVIGMAVTCQVYFLYISSSQTTCHLFRHIFMSKNRHINVYTRYRSLVSISMNPRYPKFIPILDI